MTDLNFTLYYTHGSYYSQKALLTLLEKGCKFDSKIINLRMGDQDAPEYMKMNPNGQVPMLKDGEKIIVESEKIMDYVDAHVKTGLRLVPDEATPIGKEVKRIRQILDDIKIDQVTFGVLLNINELSTSGVKMPKPVIKFIQPKLQNEMATASKRFERLAEKNPDLRTAYLAKADMRRDFITNVLNKELVKGHLKNIDRKCDQLEESLKKAKTAGEEVWIAGSQFTAADIAVIVFMDRMSFLGLEDRFFGKNTRPLLNEYFQNIGQRKTVQLLRSDSKKGMWSFFWMLVKHAIPYVASLATVGLAAGIAIWFLKNK